MTAVAQGRHSENVEDWQTFPSKVTSLWTCCENGNGAACPWLVKHSWNDFETDLWNGFETCFDHGSVLLIWNGSGNVPWTWNDLWTWNDPWTWNDYGTLENGTYHESDHESETCHGI